MPLFIAKRTLPGITPEALMSAGSRTKTCCAEMTQEGESVRWIRSFFLPATDQTYCCFDAASKQQVEEANRRARVPFDEIVEAMELIPEAV